MSDDVSALDNPTPISSIIMTVYPDAIPILYPDFMALHFSTPRLPDDPFTRNEDGSLTYTEPIHPPAPAPVYDHCEVIEGGFHEPRPEGMECPHSRFTWWRDRTAVQVVSRICWMFNRLLDRIEKHDRCIKFGYFDYIEPRRYDDDYD